MDLIMDLQQFDCRYMIPQALTRLNAFRFLKISTNLTFKFNF